MLYRGAEIGRAVRGDMCVADHMLDPVFELKVQVFLIL